MNQGAAVPWTQPDVAKRRWLFAGLLGLGSLVTVGAAIVSDGSLIAAVAPVLAVAGLCAIWVAPLRLALFPLVFLGLAVDAAGDGGPWQSPLAPLGRLVTENLNRTILKPRVALPLMALVLGYLLVIHLHRLVTKSRIDHPGGPHSAKPLSWALGFSCLTVVALVIVGVVRSGAPSDLQMAKNQVQNFLLLLLTAYLLAVSLRGRRDYRVLLGVIVAAACSKALLAVWIAFFVDFTPDPSSSYVTYHGDSILWASATIMLLARFAEQPNRRSALLSFGLLPLLLVAMVVNNRRIVWVEIAAAVITLAYVIRRTRLKRVMARAALLSLPLVLAYVSVGWTSTEPFFAPLKVFRTIQDAKVDGSTLFRDIENFNLLHTIRWSPFLGVGFGHPFTEVVKNFDLSYFKEYRYLPHNSVLGLWAFGGVFGFTGLMTALVVGIFLAARSYEWARFPDERVAAVSAIAIVLIYLIQAYGDIGFSEREGIFLVGPALGVAGRLAITTGAWNAPSPSAIVKI